MRKIQKQGQVNDPWYFVLFQLSLDSNLKHDSLSQSPDLAKLNPNCHMKYLIIFTEITCSFYLETSIFEQRVFLHP